MFEPELKPSDSVEIIVLVDNYTDFLAEPVTPVDHRPRLEKGAALLAEHGLSCLVRISARGKTHSILLDTGLTPVSLPYNMRQLGIAIGEIECVVLSHGHFDHTGGLSDFLSRASCQVPLVLHPDAFLKRRLSVAGKGTHDLPQLDPVILKKAGADILKREHASTLAAGHLLVTGEIPRITQFEKGLPGAEAYAGDRWIPDPIRDDQAMVINVDGKGLVVLSGCAHAGIINTVEYAQKITGIDHVYAVMGGFHLSGRAFAPVIPPTIESMKRIDPDYIVPMHCTGWDAINRFMTAMPGKCILNTVGTTYVF